MCKQCANVKPQSRPVSVLANAIRHWQSDKRGEAIEYVQALSRADLVQFVSYVISGKFTDEARQIVAMDHA